MYYTPTFVYSYNVENVWHGLAQHVGLGSNSHKNHTNQLPDPSLYALYSVDNVDGLYKTSFGIVRDGHIHRHKNFGKSGQIHASRKRIRKRFFVSFHN